MMRHLHIGITSAHDIRIRFQGRFSPDTASSGRRAADSWILFSAADLTGEVRFTPEDFSRCHFEVEGVCIGKGFHWQRNESQKFKGELCLRNDGRNIIVINVIPVEEYLKSVISSEMSADASIEFLKAHAIISRTWIINRMIARAKKTGLREVKYTACGNAEERIRWYDDSQHQGFDVCADDHCQRYQGFGRISNPVAAEAVETTHGMVLTYDGQIIDARFSKCCGGVSESFENCWEPVRYPYLSGKRDAVSGELPNLTDNLVAEKWIGDNPECFCNTSDRKILSQVLNDYDLETNDFFRWRIVYSQNELSDNINDRSGIDFGTVTDLIPLSRGVSGRITRLKIVGTHRSMVIGKELEIRKTLSASHLYSSAFSVSRSGTDFIINGAGWGHGVGLCQIGAAMMAHRNYRHTDILTHYYPGCEITNLCLSDFPELQSDSSDHDFTFSTY